MESASIVDMFKRSAMSYGVRYTEYLGDGDSKAIRSINDSQVYGPDVTVEKLECVNHVSKRMYARLDSLKASLRKQQLQMERYFRKRAANHPSYERSPVVLWKSYSKQQGSAGKHEESYIGSVLS